MIETLRNDQDLKIRYFAVEALGEIGDSSAVPALIEDLEKDDMLSSGAAFALGKIGDRSAVPALIKALKSKDPLTRVRAVNALGTIEDTSAVPDLTRVIVEDKNPDVKIAAAEALRKFQDPSAIPALEIVFRRWDRNGKVRLAVTNTLEKFGRLSINVFISALLHHDDPYVRHDAALALGTIYDPLTLPVLKAALRDPDEYVRDGAQVAINRITLYHTSGTRGERNELLSFDKLKQLLISCGF